MERQTIAEVVQKSMWERETGITREIWHNHAIDNKSNFPSPRPAREAKCSVAGRGNVATLRLITHRLKPRFTDSRDAYVVLMDEVAETRVFTRCSQSLCVEGGDGKTG